MNVNADAGGDADSVVDWDGDDGEGFCWPARARCSEASMSACEGSRREASISLSAGLGVCIVGGGGGGMQVDDEARASQAAFSSSSLVQC